MAGTMCRNLRTKKNQILALQDADSPEEQLFLSCFCVKTLHAVGPDDDMVGPAACRTGRKCFEPLA
jgi:hypothetical protein